MITAFAKMPQRWRAGIVLAAALVVMGGIGWRIHQASQSCGWLDLRFGWSGCIGRYPLPENTEFLGLSLPGLAFTPDGKMLALAIAEIVPETVGTSTEPNLQRPALLRLDAATGATIGTTPAGERERGMKRRTIAISWSGRYAAAIEPSQSGTKGRLRLWRLPDMTLVWDLRKEFLPPPFVVSFSLDDNAIVTASARFSVADGRETEAKDDRVPRRWNLDRAEGLVGDLRAELRYTNEPAAILDILDPSGKLVRSIPTGLNGFDNVWMNISADGKRLALTYYETAARTGHVQAYEVTSGERLLDAALPGIVVNLPPAWSPDGCRVAVEAMGASAKQRNAIALFRISGACGG